MPILGLAIARHLSNLKGLYSVELPEPLIDEMQDIVMACNSLSPNRALLVTDDVTTIPGVVSITWDEILGWRTEDDRVFVWQRGGREPDSSFQSVVRPFISHRFPAATGGECNLDTLARIGTSEIWTQLGYPGTGEVFEAFLSTSRWVLGALSYAFEHVGSVPGVHWTDKFLMHWAAVLKMLADGIASLGSPPSARHAWEIIRLAGLPVPGLLAVSGNPFLYRPADLPEYEWKQYAEHWQDVIDEYILPAGQVALLLAALDANTPGAVKTTPWRGLPWEQAQKSYPETAAPLIGQAVFTPSPALSIISNGPPAIPAPTAAWWGVTTTDIDHALSDLSGPCPLQPSATCTNLVALSASHARIYVLRTREGTIETSHTPRKWKVRLNLDVEFVFKEQWRNLSVSSVQPTSAAQDGDVWIDPTKVKITSRGSGVSTSGSMASLGTGNHLIINATVHVDYACDMNPTNAVLSGGCWNPNHSLVLAAEIRDFISATWGPPRLAQAAVSIIVPSPFVPTIIVSKPGKKVLAAPNKGDEYGVPINGLGTWTALDTPDLLLDEEDDYEIWAYDGSVACVSSQFQLPTQISVNGHTIPSVPNITGWFETQYHLDQDDTFTTAGPAGPVDIAVIRIRERSKSSVSSGILAAVRRLTAGHRQPSAQARSSLLGQYQTHIAPALTTPPSGAHNSLYQYVISSTEQVEQWHPHSGGTLPERMVSAVGSPTLPGIGSGPSDILLNTSEWSRFMTAIEHVCQSLKIQPGSADFWISGFDPGQLPVQVLREYMEAHRDLVTRSKSISQTDSFWACYPFSVVIVEGVQGSNYGQVQAVLLSPLHPARLGWAFGVAVLARAQGVEPTILGLAEGWNIPYSGFTVNPAGQTIPMVAVPIDPGDEQDFAAWSALAVLSSSGLAPLPSLAAGLPMPWGGKTGINQTVVQRAITDYLKVHPHLNAIEVDIRSVDQAPRSAELDDAVLRLLGTGDLSEIAQLGGGIRVWDANFRLGSPPTRDKLFGLRSEDKRGNPFEWRRYDQQHLPEYADLALIENSSVHLSFTPGTAQGVGGPLLIRRFAPPVLHNLALDQNYKLSPGEDILGLSSLLSEIEHDVGTGSTALRSTPHITALGVGRGARWEVIGTFNIPTCQYKVRQLTSTNLRDYIGREGFFHCQILNLNQTFVL